MENVKFQNQQMSSLLTYVENEFTYLQILSRKLSIGMKRIAVDKNRRTPSLKLSVPYEKDTTIKHEAKQLIKP